MNGENWKGKKVLVAGGAGMIGAHLARRLVKYGADVTIADNLSSGSAYNIKDIRKDAMFYQVDLRDSLICQRLTQHKDVVFQLAANMGGIGWISTIGADIMRDSGLINTNMLEAARLACVPKYFYSSSA